MKPSRRGRARAGAQGALLQAVAFELEALGGRQPCAGARAHDLPTEAQLGVPGRGTNLVYRDPALCFLSGCAFTWRLFSVPLSVGCIVIRYGEAMWHHGAGPQDQGSLTTCH